MDLSLSMMDLSMIDDILEIETKSFPSPWPSSFFSKEFTCKTAYNYVVKNNLQKIVAYMCFRIIMDEMHILKFAVSPEERRKGIGSRLLDGCTEIALKKGAFRIFLEVRNRNETAVLFYRKFGFEVIGRRPNYYPETREDALVMMKQIKEVL